MELYVLDQDRNQIAVIDDYKSLIWAKRYSTFGDCELYLRATKEHFSVLQKGYYLERSDDDMVCRIEAIGLETDTENGDYLIVTGYDVRKILNQRIVRDTITFDGTAENFIRKMITANVTNPSEAARKISEVTLGSAKGFSDPWEEQVTFDRVFDKIQEVCQTIGWGSRMPLGNDRKFIFNLYQGIDRSYGQNVNDFVIFSPEFDNISSSKYLSDSSNIVTVAVVGGAGEGVDRSIKVVGNASGIDRHEAFIDAKDVSRDIDYSALTEAYPGGTMEVDNVTVYYKWNNQRIAILDHVANPTKATLQDVVYLSKLIGKGEETIAENSGSVSFDGDIETLVQFHYKEDFDLGDIVTIQNEYGLGANARIVEVIETFDENGYTVTPTFEYKEGN